MEVAAAKQLLPMPPRDPTSPSSSTSSSSPSSPSRQQQQQRHHPLPPSPRPAVPRVIDTTPFPTTFVQADTASFKQVVQMLTGSSDTPASPKPAAKNHHHHHNNHGSGGLSGVPCRPKKPAFKLYDRRGLKNLKMIAPLAMAAAAAGPSPRKTEVLSPSVLDFPSLALGSPVTPLLADPFNRSSPASASASPGEEEAAAIAHKGFFLHPSPRSVAPPRLLPLFPVTSPRTAAPASQ